MITGSSYDGNISEFPAMVLFTEWKYILPTLFICILFSIALNYIRDDIQAGLKEMKRSKRNEIRH